MEDLLGFLFVIIGIVASIKKNQKKKQQTQARKAVRQEIASRKQNRAPYSMESLQAWFEEETEEKQPAVLVESVVAASTGSVKEQTHEGLHPCDVHEDAPKQVAQPSIQARVQVTESPLVVMGSMQTDTHEGIHPCDEHADDLMQSDKPLIPMNMEKPGLQLDWTGENMVKAFIMQEVLTRPAQRRRA